LSRQRFPTQAAKSTKLTSTSLSVPKPETNQTQKKSTSEDEEENIHEAVGSYDPNFQEIDSYDEINAIMPRFKPINDWHKNIDVVRVLYIFAASLERHKKDTTDDSEWVNHKTHPTKKSRHHPSILIVFFFC